MNDLKPCPFCGGVPLLNYKAGFPGYSHSCANVECKECGSFVHWIQGTMSDDESVKDLAAQAWNRRVTINE